MKGAKKLSFLLILVLKLILVCGIDDNHTWGYTCTSNRCIKTLITSQNVDAILSLQVCRLYCYDDIGTLWPKPTGKVEFSRKVTEINPAALKFQSENFKNNFEFFEMATKRFDEMQMKKFTEISTKGKSVTVNVATETDDMSLDYDTNESYNLKIEELPTELKVSINSKTFFGARHAIETLSQLIVYDDLNKKLVILSNASIVDEPRFKHRGISLDTSRNFYTVKTIKKTLDGLAMAKLNSLHWHITDSQAFPMEIKSHLDLTKFGAYSRDKVYKGTDIQEIVKFAKSRGVRVIPEFDAPAHIGEGWQKKLELTTCVDYTPYLDYCWQPPCGHLDPTKDKVYDVLEDIYREMLEYFTPPAFHMGGDEIFFSCWNSSESLQQWMINKGWKLDRDGFLQLWGYFQENALKRVDKVSEKQLPIILWTGYLTDQPYASRYLDTSRYIIQVWTRKDDEVIKQLLDDGYRLILSNNDALYLDCGYGSWASERYVWCSPYHQWQKIYNNDLDEIGGERVGQILGASATLFAEAVDENNLDAKLWPRASALAERLWTNPKENWRIAEPRFLMHQMYLKSVGGFAAEVLQPEWCVHNEGLCQL